MGERGRKCLTYNALFCFMRLFFEQVERLEGALQRSISSLLEYEQKIYSPATP